MHDNIVLNFSYIFDLNYIHASFWYREYVIILQKFIIISIEYILQLEYYGTCLYLLNFFFFSSLLTEKHIETTENIIKLKQKLRNNMLRYIILNYLCFIIKILL